MCLFQVVSQDLLELLDAILPDALEPVGVPLVQLGTERLGRGLVGGIADQLVAEPERVLARERRPIRPEHVASDQAHQGRLDLPAVQQRHHRAHVELFAAHRRPLDHRPLVAGELLEPRGQQRLDRRRHPQVDQRSCRHPPVAVASQRTVVDQHREHLLDEQRRALGRGEDPIARLVRKRRATEQVPDQVAALVVGERLERDRRGVELAPAPARPLVQQLRPRDAEHQDRRLSRPARDVFDQVQERGLAPVDVVEHHGERCRLRDRLQERPDRPERLLDRAVAIGRGEELRERRARRTVRPEHRADLPLDLVRCVEVIQAGRLLHDLAHGEERDPLAVREAPASEDRGLSERTEELLDQPGLADPGVPRIVNS